MQLIKKPVHRYLRNYNKKDKKGNIKEYSSEQVIIRLPPQSPFHDKEEVYILSIDHYQALKSKVESNEKEIDQLFTIINNLQNDCNDKNHIIKLLQNEIFTGNKTN